MLAVDDRRPGPIVPAKMNLTAHVLFQNNASDANVALEVIGSDANDQWSYGRLRRAVMVTAAGLQARGLKQGARVLMRLGNSPDFVVVYLGAIAAGFVPVPTSAALGVDEITKIATSLDPDLIVAHAGIAQPKGAYETVSPNELLAASPLSAPVMAASDDLAYIVYTSGTASAPMGVKHAHRAILARSMMFGGWYGLQTSDRVLHAGAFNWTFTLGTGLLDPWTKGATALVLTNGTEMGHLPELAGRHKATILAGAPGVFRRMLKSPLPELPHLRHSLSAGEKLPETLREKWQDMTGTILHEAFGQSECSTFISGAPDRPAPPGTVGFAQPGRRIAILGDDKPVERGQPGEIAIDAADPGLTLGYLNRPIEARNGWCPTGDIGVMRKDGSIEYHGRADDILTAGGFRVSPLEVEAAMQQLSGIEDAIAIDRAITPESTVIALHYTGERKDEATLKAHAETHLARHKQPRLFVHEQRLPKNANGKLLRKALKAAIEGAL